MARREFAGILVMATMFLLLIGGLGVSLLVALGPHEAQSERVVKDLRSEADRLARQGKLTAAIDALSRAIEQNPNDGAAYVERGHLLRRSGNDVAAERDYSKAIDVGDRSVDTFLARARMRTRLGEFDAAIGDYGEALGISPKMALAYRDRGRLNQRVQNFERAAADFRRARVERPGLPNIDQELAWALWGTGEYERALVAFDESVAKAPGRSHGHFGRGVTLYHLDRFDDATTALQRVIGNGGNGSDYAHYYLWLATVRSGYGPEADTVLRRFLDVPASQQHGAWSLRIAAFLLGDISEDELLAEAESGVWIGIKEQQCEACFYAGARRLLDDERDMAIELFRRARATEVTNYYEFHSAGAELGKLGL